MTKELKIEAVQYVIDNLRAGIVDRFYMCLVMDSFLDKHTGYSRLDNKLLEEKKYLLNFFPEWHDFIIDNGHAREEEDEHFEYGDSWSLPQSIDSVNLKKDKLYELLKRLKQ